MNCPICNSMIKEDSKFCAICGRKIPRCPTCGKVLRRQERFCTQDGTRIPEEIRLLFADQQIPEREADAVSDAVIKQTQAPDAVSDAVIKQTQEADTVSDAAIKQTQAPDAVSDAVVKQAPAPVKEPVKKKKGVSLYKIIAVLWCLLLVLCIGGYFVIKNASASSEAIRTVSEADGAAVGSYIIDRSGEQEARITETGETEHTEETEPEADGETEAEPEAVSEQEDDPVLYFIMHCDREYFPVEYLEGFDADMCRIARNGIYARLGRKFQDEELQAYFEQYSWYRPEIEPEDFSESMLNDWEAANRDLITAYEKEQGFR